MATPGRKRKPKQTPPDENYIIGIRKACFDTVYPHIFGNSDREVGGVLVGWSQEGNKLPVVEAAIAAISADEQRATLTFTQDSWEYIHKVIDEEYPESQIVGWYHSHPGFGIFLSDHDMFIQENFFNGPSQIALVVDPLAGTEGVFVWEGGKVVEHFNRGTPKPFQGQDPHRRGSERSSVAAVEETVQPTRTERGFATGLIVWMVVAAIVGLGIGFGGYQVLSGDDKPEAITRTDAEAPATKPEDQSQAQSVTGVAGSNEGGVTTPAVPEPPR